MSMTPALEALIAEFGNTTLRTVANAPAPKPTPLMDIVTMNGCHIQVKSVEGGIEAARAIEALGDLSDLLHEAAPWDMPVGLFI